jgi:hypothetical protein
MNEATEYAWAAGFVDGEGCFIMSANSHNDSYTVGLVVSQTHPEPLDELARLFGGVVKLRKAPTAAGSPVYIWRIGGVEKLSPVLEEIVPYLKFKQRQAELLLMYCKTVGYDRTGVPHMVHLRRRHIHRHMTECKH